MATNIQQIIASSIHHRRRLFIRYNGQAHARVIEPHLLYRTPEGMLALVAYQVRGYQSSDRRGTFWRPFQLNRIDSISATNENFSPRVRQGYETVAALTQGKILSKLDVRPEERAPANRRLRRAGADLRHRAQAESGITERASLSAD